MKPARQLYQLHSRSKLREGSYVAINGPWDRFGYVVYSKPDADKFINLIRGCAVRADETPVAKF